MNPMQNMPTKDVAEIPAAMNRLGAAIEEASKSVCELAARLMTVSRQESEKDLGEPCCAPNVVPMVGAIEEFISNVNRVTRNARSITGRLEV